MLERFRKKMWKERVNIWKDKDDEVGFAQNVIVPLWEERLASNLPIVFLTSRIYLNVLITIISFLTLHSFYYRTYLQTYAIRLGLKEIKYFNIIN